METKIVESVGVESEGIPLYSIRWAAIFASLAVGMGVQILLMLAGVAAGFAVYGAGSRPDGTTMSIAALVWNGIAMFVGAWVGGYVAARASGLRRNVDGMLHGVVSWGASLLFFVLLTGTLTGSAVTSVFSLAGPVASLTRGTDSTTMSELLSGLERGDRNAAVGVLRDRFGLTEEQAASAADRALAMTGRGGAAATNPPGPDSEDAAKAASAATAGLSVMILLSLIAGAGGGLVGAHGARKRALPGRHAEQRVYRHTTTSGRVPTAGLS